MASVGLFELGWVLLKGIPPLTNISDDVPKCNWLSVPISDPEVFRGWGKRRFETGDPITRSR